MKSIILFTFFTLLANTFGCGSREEPEPIHWPEYSGYWDIRKLHLTIFDTNNQLIGQSKQEYKSGERGIAFNPENKVYHEMENKISVKSCPYYSYGNQELVLKFTPDSALAEIQNLGETSMDFIIEEKNSAGKIVKILSAERASYP